MSAQSEMLAKIIEHINIALPELFSTVSAGHQSPENGISAQVCPGHGLSRHFDRGFLQKMPVLLLAKHTSQKTAADALFEICNLLDVMRDYPAVDGCEITSIKTATTPNFVDASLSGHRFIWSAIIEIEFYLKRE